MCNNPKLQLFDVLMLIFCSPPPLSSRTAINISLWNFYFMKFLTPVHGSLFLVLFSLSFCKTTCQWNRAFCRHALGLHSKLRNIFKDINILLIFNVVKLTVNLFGMCMVDVCACLKICVVDKSGSYLCQIYLYVHKSK